MSETNVQRYICFGSDGSGPQEGGRTFLCVASSLTDAFDVISTGKYKWAHILDLVTGKLYMNTHIVQKEVPGA